MGTRMVCALVACLACLSWALPATAQEELTRFEIEQLLERIDAQNERILALEQQLEQEPKFSPIGYSNWQGDDEAADAGLQEQLDSLEETLGEISEQVDELAGDKTVVHSGSSKSTMKVVGRVHADYWAFPNTAGDIDNFEDGDPQDRLGFRRVRFGVRGDIVDNMEYRIEMEFTGGNDVEFRDVWLGWKELPFLQKVLLGNQKRPYGLDHLNSSRFNVFLERPFIIESFNQDARRLGLVSYGVSDDQAYNWRYGVYNLRLIQDEGNYVNDHYQLEFAGRLANTFWWDEVSDGRGYGHWAISGSIANPDGTAGDDNEARFRHRPEARSANRWINTDHIVGANAYGLFGAETVLNIGPVQMVGEYQSVWLDRNAAVGTDLHFHGGYFYVSYFLTGEHMPWSRSSGTLARIKPFQNFWIVDTCDDGVEAGWGAWQIAGRYSYGDLTDGDIFGGIGESFTFGLNWYWNENARMQFNFINGEIRDRFATLDSGDYSIVGARFMVDF